jgi:hypothetical protein
MRPEDEAPKAHDAITPKPKVVALPPPDNRETVELLEGWLARAKTGEIQGVMMLANLTGNEFDAGWSVGDHLLRLGMLERLKYDLMATKDEEDE